jgi:hypothetical protein
VRNELGRLEETVAKEYTTAFERHYRIGDRARAWGLGRETIRKLVMHEPGDQNSARPKESAHDLQRAGIRGTTDPQSFECGVTRMVVF